MDRTYSHELWKDHNPTFKHLKVQVCLTKVEFPISKRVQIETKTIACICIGYAYNNSAYRFLIFKSYITYVHTNKII